MINICKMYNYKRRERKTEILQFLVPRKLKISDFYYNYILENYVNNAEQLFTLTYSLLYEICAVIYLKIFENIKKRLL